MIYRLLFRLILARLDAERAHALAAGCARFAGPVLRRLGGRPDPVLRVRALGLDFPSPLGAAAGTDKSATWFEAQCALGFGFAEVGTVTVQAQNGNPRPRVFRLVHDRALINRLGFPNDGASAVAARLARRRRGGAVVGANVGKSFDVPLEYAGEDYRATVQLVGAGADYLVLNVSSPNTPGLRGIQAERERLSSLLDSVLAELGTPRVPVLLKIGPDLDDVEIDAIADLAVERGLEGIVAVNTTVSRPSVASAGAAAIEGGLSGPPLGVRALEVLRRLRTRTGDRLTLISVGGIETPEDAWERILAGASLVQAYTAFVYGGPLWPSRMNRGLARLVRESGYTSLQAAVGAENGPPVAPPGPRPDAVD